MAALVKKPPANAGDTGFAALKISHGVEQLRCVPQLWNLCSGARALQLESSPALQLEKACAAAKTQHCQKPGKELGIYCMFALLMKQELHVAVKLGCTDENVVYDRTTLWDGTQV